jgi:hypothetical protein
VVRLEGVYDIVEDTAEVELVIARELGDAA